MTHRKPVSSLEGQRIGKIMPVHEHYEFRNTAGKVLFTVLTVDLFDAEGKRFECDVPSALPRDKTHPFRVQYRLMRTSNLWRFETLPGERRRHARFTTREEAQSYCDMKMALTSRLPSEEWKVFSKP